MCGWNRLPDSSEIINGHLYWSSLHFWKANYNVNLILNYCFAVGWELSFIIRGFFSDPRKTLVWLYKHSLVSYFSLIYTFLLMVQCAVKYAPISSFIIFIAFWFVSALQHSKVSRKWKPSFSKTGLKLKSGKGELVLRK